MLCSPFSVVYFSWRKESHTICQSPHQSYSTSLAALQTSNEDLENKMCKLSAGTSRLNRDLLKLRRQVDSFHNECLSTWQADILTRLIEVVHIKQRRKLPWGIAVGKGESQDRELVSRAYVTAAGRIGRKVLEQKFNLGSKYHDALKRYNEVSSWHCTFIFAFAFSPSSDGRYPDRRVSQLKPLPKRATVRAVSGIREGE